MKLGIAMGCASAVMCLAGCAKTITMVYHSNPEGAVIIQNNHAIGHAPVTAKYKAPDTFNAGGCASLSETAALWQSGAQAILPQITVCRQNTYLQRVDFVRPGVPGEEIDLQAAYTQQAEREAGQAVDDETEQENLNALGAMAGWLIGTEAGRH